MLSTLAERSLGKREYRDVLNINFHSIILKFQMQIYFIFPSNISLNLSVYFIANVIVIDVVVLGHEGRH